MTLGSSAGARAGSASLRDRGDGLTHARRHVSTQGDHHAQRRCRDRRSARVCPPALRLLLPFLLELHLPGSFEDALQPLGGRATAALRGSISLHDLARLHGRPEEDQLLAGRGDCRSHRGRRRGGRSERVSEGISVLHDHACDGASELVRWLPTSAVGCTATVDEVSQCAHAQADSLEKIASGADSACDHLGKPSKKDQGPSVKTPGGLRQGAAPVSRSSTSLRWGETKPSSQ